MSCENCTNCTSKQFEVEPECKVYYAMVRIETDKPIKEVSSKLEKVENDVGALTRIDVIQTTMDQDPEIGTPVLYWP